MESAKPFDAAGQGVNVTYKNDRKRRRANVFIYPVAEKNQELKHRDLVMGSQQPEQWEFERLHEFRQPT